MWPTHADACSLKLQLQQGCVMQMVDLEEVVSPWWQAQLQQSKAEDVLR